MAGDLLLISNSTNPGEGYLEHCASNLVNHFEGRRHLAFVPYALADLDGYAATAETRFSELGFEMRSVHRARDPLSVLAEAEGVFIGGGNTFRLLDRMRRHGLLEAIRSRVVGGMPYSGASAGSNVACPTIKTTNDMPIVDPDGFEALGLFPHQINAHYTDRDPDVAHGGETREQRIAEFHEENDTPVVGLYEGSMLHRRSGQTRLFGPRGAKLFVKGRPPEMLSPGAVYDSSGQ